MEIPELFVATLSVAAFLWAFWALYVFTMAIYRAHLNKNLGKFNTVMAFPIVGIAWLVDVFANIVIAPFVFWELPRELLVTDRLKKIMAGGSTARNHMIAVWLCDSVLDPFDPTGNHC